MRVGGGVNTHGLKKLAIKIDFFLFKGVIGDVPRTSLAGGFSVSPSSSRWGKGFAWESPQGQGGKIRLQNQKEKMGVYLL